MSDSKSMALSAARSSCDEKIATESRAVTPPPKYPASVAKTETTELDVKSPDLIQERQSLEEAQPVPQVQVQEQEYCPVEQPSRHYNFDISFPGVMKGIEEGMKPYGSLTRYAWHKMRLALRGFSIFLVLAVIFLLIAKGKDAYNEYYSYPFYWSVTMISVIPVTLAINIFELLITSANGRGINPNAQCALDVVVFVGLLGSGAIDAKPTTVRPGYYLCAASLFIIASLVQLACAIFGGLAILRLRKDRF